MWYGSLTHLLFASIGAGSRIEAGGLAVDLLILMLVFPQQRMHKDPCTGHAFTSLASPPEA